MVTVDKDEKDEELLELLVRRMPQQRSSRRRRCCLWKLRMKLLRRNKVRIQRGCRLNATLCWGGEAGMWKQMGVQWQMCSGHLRQVGRS